MNQKFHSLELPAPIKTRSIPRLLLLFKNLLAQSQVPQEVAFRGEFLGPSQLGRTSLYALGILGLKDWWGKEFTSEGHAFNLVRGPDGLKRALPMVVTIQPSQFDTKPSLILSYAKSSPFPWPLIKSEVRRYNYHSMMGLTMLDLPGLSKIVLPYLLLLEPHVHIVSV